MATDTLSTVSYLMHLKNMQLSSIQLPWQTQIFSDKTLQMLLLPKSRPQIFMRPKVLRRWDILMDLTIADLLISKSASCIPRRDVLASNLFAQNLFWKMTAQTSIVSTISCTRQLLCQIPFLFWEMWGTFQIKSFMSWRTARKRTKLSTCCQQRCVENCRCSQSPRRSNYAK